ncbi:MAG TPA: hypothetical protein VHZ52_15975 [Acidobacteriaceae bacterium]|jgi:hypothetical protein|nr:hypothetical protein [Acidobacteriaceae bacterium]
MHRKTAAICTFALSTLLFACGAANASKVLKPSQAFLLAQRCHINGTVDYGCFQANLPRFEEFVLVDEAGWLQKSIVAEGLVKTYDALHITSANAAAVQAKAKIFAKVSEVLDKSEMGEIDDCKDEANPDACLKARYCFKEAYIKVKNILVTNEPERFQAEIRWFDKQGPGNC